MEYIGITKPEEQLTSESIALASIVPVKDLEGKEIIDDSKTIVSAEQLSIGESFETSDAVEIKISADMVIRKPKIDPSILLTKEQAEEVKVVLKESGCRLIHQALTPAKNDYTHDLDRGTVKYSPSCRNYSFHKVIIPDGTTVKDSNFSQLVPHTAAITGKDLTFIGCNLVNVEIDPLWVVKCCNVSQIKRVYVSEEVLEDGQIKVLYSLQVEKNGEFSEAAKETENVSPVDYDKFMLRLTEEVK